MSTASPVPETFGLHGDDAVATLRRAKLRRLLADSFLRLRWADGFSHSRAMAFQLVLTVIPGTIALVALAAELRWDTLSSAIVRLTRSLAPGPAAGVFESAFGQGAQAGHGRSGALPLVFGGLAFVISGATAFGQIERAANRIYGVEADRPTVHKYGLATVLMVSSGMLVVVCVAIIGLGADWFRGAGGHGLAGGWAVARWPTAGVLLVAAFALVLKLSPRRHQPGLSWLAVGALLGVAGAFAISLLLHLYLHASSGFGDTYGPLAGFIGVMLWAYLCSIVLLYGIAFAAQLEAFRAGAAEPRSAEKVVDSDPPSDRTPLGDNVAMSGG